MFFIAIMILMIICGSTPIITAAPAIIGYIFATITVINTFGAKSLMGAVLSFVLLQSTVASHAEDNDTAHEVDVSGPVEENDPESEVDRVAVAVLSAWLVTAVVIVTLTGESADFERPNHNTEDGTGAASTVGNEELGYQGNAALKFNCEMCHFKSTYMGPSSVPPNCQGMWSKITGTSGIVDICCPGCNETHWHCSKCGEQWL